MKKLVLSACICSLGFTGFAQKTPVKYISTADAVGQYADEIKAQPFLVFPEHREEPIQWFDSLRLKWLDKDPASGDFTMHARPGEYFVFQAGIWAIGRDLNITRVKFTDLKAKSGNRISSAALTCFNTGGVDYRGNAFTKKVKVPAGEVQALWMGINTGTAARGTYSGEVTIEAISGAGSLYPVSKKINIQLIIDGDPVPDHGFDEAKTLSRLSWINSTAGMDSQVPRGFLPVSRKLQVLSISGRSLQIGADGLPEKITSYFTPSNQSISSTGSPILDAPFHFVIEKENGERIHLKPGKLRFLQSSASVISWEVKNESNDCDLICSGELQFDGFVNYHLTLEAKKELSIRDIRLEVAMSKEKSVYMMGLNKEGGTRPESWQWKWDTAKNQDALWLGAVNGGLRIKWKAENYRLPLVNIYYAFGKLRLPPSWGNAGKGGVNLYEKGKTVMLNAYSGSREMKSNERLHYDFELLITPFKTMNKQVQFGDRYYHSGNPESSAFIRQADSLGANIINVHQGNDIYPFINYPYSDVNKKELTRFIDLAHQDNKRVKVYYTTRELTVNLPELLPFVSLNGEIIYPGPGATAKTLIHPEGPDPWLKQQLRGRQYIPAWLSTISSGRYAGLRDISLITTPNSRLNNYYVAGLNWMVHHMHIDGIYIDDCSLDRTTLCRARKILDNNRRDARIDMHSWNHFNPQGGFASCLNLYMDLLPYIDQVWIGENRNYNTPPDYWLTEIAGIPFGLPGQMLDGGGNAWRGMVYGITDRAGWQGPQPNAIWKFWDDYKLPQMTMMGYWEAGNPVSVNNPAIRVTVYKGKGTAVLAIGNFSEKEQECSLGIDYSKLGFSGSPSLDIPYIENYQQAQANVSAGHLRVPAGKGYLVVLNAER